jgi:hypothetical protein
MSNAVLIRINQALKAIMWLSGAIAGMKAAGQLPPSADKFLPFVALAGAAAAYFAKTPSQAIAAAVPPPKPAPPAP